MYSSLRSFSNSRLQAAWKIFWLFFTRAGCYPDANWRIKWKRSPTFSDFARTLMGDAGKGAAKIEDKPDAD